MVNNMREELDEVLPGVFIGGEEAAWNQELLTALGITHVVNCAKSIHNAWPAHFCYLHLLICDDPTERIINHFGHTNEYS